MNYEIMDEVVDKLCYSLVNETEQWVFATFTFHNKKSPTVRYWSHTNSQSITETFDSKTSNKVFSHDQGKRIYNAYLKALEKKSTVAQQKVIDSFNTQKEEVVKPLPLMPETKKTSKFKFWPF